MKNQFKCCRILLILGILLAVLGLDILWSMTALQTTTYEFASPKISEHVHFVFLSDLHCRNFGKHNQELCKRIADQKPDFIALVGDIVNRGSTQNEIDELCSFIKDLTEIAPVYYSLGNHEEQYISTNGDEVLQQIESTSAILLNDTYIDVDIHGQSLRLGGMIKLAYLAVEKEEDEENIFLDNFCNTDGLKIMLSHRPEGFYFGDACKVWNVDFILSGHTHGGLIRLPFVGGLYAPIQGFFPKVYYGEYKFENNLMVITSGLAGHGVIPRINNPPEIVVIDLVPETTQER